MGWWSFGLGSTSCPWGIKFTRPKSNREYKKWVMEQCEFNLDDSLVRNSYKALSLDEKIMLGLRLKEGINIKRSFEDAGWDEFTIQNNLGKLMQTWEKYKELGLLCNEGYRYFLSDPKGMELSNQILISMFEWWDEIN